AGSFPTHHALIPRSSFLRGRIPATELRRPSEKRSMWVALENLCFWNGYFGKACPQHVAIVEAASPARQVMEGNEGQQRWAGFARMKEWILEYPAFQPAYATSRIFGGIPVLEVTPPG